MKPLLLRVHAAIALVFMAIGVWIIIAPTAVGFQPKGAAWVEASVNDVIVGSALVVSSLGLLVAQITATIRLRRRIAGR